MPTPGYFTPNSTDEIISKGLRRATDAHTHKERPHTLSARPLEHMCAPAPAPILRSPHPPRPHPLHPPPPRSDGDVLLFNTKCSRLPPHEAALCAASKYGISGDGTHGWDHAAVVLRDRATGVPWLLEGGRRGVTMRTYEERLLQGDDHQEVLLLPLRGAARAEGASAALHEFVAELKLSRTADGFDGDGATRCRNLWRTYRDLCAPPRPGAGIGGGGGGGGGGGERPPCLYGATLVTAALQRMGALGPQYDPREATPARLPQLPLEPPAVFGRPVPLRSMRAQ